MYIQSNDKMNLIKNDQQLQQGASGDETDSACIDRRYRKRSRSTSSSLDRENKGRKEVSFNKMTTCLEIPHIDDMKQKVIKAQWLSEQEMRDIKDMANEIARYMTDKCGEQVINDSDEYSFRGLEYRTLEGFRHSRKNKNIVRGAVILQQQLYGVGGNPGRVAFASMRNSLVSRKEAVERAKLDELWVQEYLAQ